ncbi:MAG: CaiB/BaiF CoA transferase family protein, partial [Caulobacteraceae bacterium]
GQTGPLASFAGHDVVYLALTGALHAIGTRERPVPPLNLVADFGGGAMYLALGMLSALLHARATGEGQHIDMALFDGQAAMLANIASNYLTSGAVPGRLGNAHASIVPYQPFPTADGFVVVAVGNDGQFRDYCRVIGAPGLSSDPRFTTNSLRVENRVELTALLGALMKGRTTAEWLALLEPEGVPCGPINTIDQVFAEPQSVARGLVIEQPRSDLSAPVRTVASPLRLSKTPPSYRNAPPALGADTRSVLGEMLGLDAAALDGLKAKGAIG